MKQQDQSKSQYFFNHSHRDVKQNSSNDKIKHNLYFSNDLLDIMSTTDKNNLTNQENITNNHQSNKKDMIVQSLQNQVMGRPSWIKSQTPRTMNYVNLSYQKIKSLNTASSLNLLNSIDTVGQSKNNRKLSGNTFDENKVRLSFVINQEFYQSPSSSRRNTLIQNSYNELDQNNEKQNQNNKVSLYQVQYDHNPIKNEQKQKQKQESLKENDSLQVQLSPIIRRLTKNSLFSNKSANLEQYSLTEKHQSKQSLQNTPLNSVIQKNKEQKSRKNDLLKKVKMQTEHAFHFSSGRARLKNKRQMFSPCQSARYECKVQFENKYLIKTAFIQPNDNNKEFQMVQVDLIQERRSKLFAKLEDIQNKKNKLTDQEKAEQQEKDDKEIEKQYELLLKKKDLNPLENPQRRLIENIKEIENSEIDDTMSKQGQQTEQSSFSDQISQIKMIDNYNIMLKGIKNQINDLDEVVLNERQQQNNYLNTSQTPSNITRDKSQLIQNPIQQISPHANLKLQANQQQIQTEKSSQNTNNSLKKQNTFTNRVQTAQSQKKKLKIKDPRCNSNEILNRYTKQSQKSPYSQISKDQNNNDFSLIIDIPTPKSKIQMLFPSKSIKSNKDSDPYNLNLHPPTSFTEAQKEKTHHFDKSRTLDLMNHGQNNLSPSQQRIFQKQNSLGQNQIKKSAFRFDQNSENNRLIKHFSSFNKYDEKITKLNLNNNSDQNEQEKQISNLSLDEYIEDQEKQQTDVLKTDESKIIPVQEINSSPKSNQLQLTQKELQMQKKQSVDQNFLSALLTSWRDQKKEIKKPISDAFVKRRVVLQRNFQISTKKIKLNYPKIKKQLLDFLNKLQKSQLTLDEFIEKQSEIFLDKPMQRIGSFVFFKAIKHNNLVGVKTIVQYCRYSVFDFDTKKQTCLHKAAKKGYKVLLEYLISKGADLNALDVAKRKPLYYALKYNHFDCVKLLLINMADPWSCENTDYYKMSAQNPSIQEILKQFRKMHLVLMFTPYKFRKTIINNTIPKASQK